MKVSELIKILENTIRTHGDIPVVIPTQDGPVFLDEPQVVVGLYGDNNEPGYSQPQIHPSGLYLLIGGQS